MNGYSKVKEPQKIDAIIKNENLVTDKKVVALFEKYNEKYFSWTYIIFFEDFTVLKYNYSFQRLCYITIDEIDDIQKQFKELREAK